MNNPNERSSSSFMCAQNDSGLILTTDPKPRLRWTIELHDRFVDAIAQLGGPDKATPKTIMSVMGVKGLTLYHLKSHLQKFRLGKHPHNKEFYDDHSVNNDVGSYSLGAHRNTGSSSRLMNSNINDGSNNVHISNAIQMQMEVQRRFQEQLEVQRHLQLRIEAQGKYMQNIIEKAYQSLAGETNTSASTRYKGSEINFPCLQDLNIYGSDQEDLNQSKDANRPSLESFMKTPSDNHKRPNPYIEDNGNSPVIWFEDLGLQELGPSTS